MKKLIKISTTVALVFTMLFTNLFSSAPEGLLKDLFGNIATEVKAATETSNYTKTGHKLHSNANMGAVAIESLGHGSSTPFRKFYMHDGDLDNNKRVICGYSEGRGHPGDSYTKKVVLAKNWKSTPNKKALWGHNTVAVSKALKWFYDDVGPNNATAKQAYFIQTYIWAKTMGRNSDTALEQLARSKKWDLKDLQKMEAKVNAQKVEGYVVIYEHTEKCVENVTVSHHQPYYRWFKVTPIKKEVTASKKHSIENTIPVEIYKQDAKTKKSVSNVTITASIGGKTCTKTTNDKGTASFSIGRKFSSTGKGSATYVENWDELTSEQKKDLKANGYWSSKTLAEKAAKEQAADNAEKKAKSELSKFKENWKFTETKAPGYVYKVNNVPKSITKTVNKDTKKVVVNFSNDSKYGEIKLQKVVSDNSVYSKEFSLEGAQYAVKNSKGEVVGTITISKVVENGKTIYSGSLGNLTIGKYTVEETKVPNGFNKDNTIHKFELIDNGGKTLTTKVLSDSKIDDSTIKSVETPKTGTVSLKKWLKTLAATETIVGEAGIKFTLKSATSFNGEATDSNLNYAKGVQKETGNGTGGTKLGEITWDKVPYGTYTITMDEGQTLAKNITFIGPITVYVQDDNDDNTDKYHGNNIQLGYGVDNTTGKPTDSLTVDEETPAGTVVVHKTKSEINKNGVKEYHPEAGAWFQILDKDGQEITEDFGKRFKTNSNGVARSNPIENPGTYILHQERGTANHAVMKDQTFEVTEADLNVKGDFKVFEFNVDNQYEGDYIYLSKQKMPFDDDSSKYLEDQKTPEEGAVFSILDVARMSAKALAQLKSEGNTWDKAARKAFIASIGDAALGELTTDKNGEASKKLDCSKGADGSPTYQIGEKGFVLLQTEGTVGYELAKPLFSPKKINTSDENRVTKDSNDSISEASDGHSFVWNADIVNKQEHLTAIAKFTKFVISGSERNAIPEKGAKFKVVKSNGEFLQKDGVDVECTADANGTVYIPWLTKGVYNLIQTAGSNYHKWIDATTEEGTFAVLESDLVFSEKDTEILINKNFSTLTSEQRGHLVGLDTEHSELTDEELPVSVKLLKTSSDTGIPLANAEFTLYKKTTGGKYSEVSTYYTDSEGKITISNLQYGTYRLRETQAPEGYLATEYDTGKEITDDDFPWQDKEFTIDENHVVDDGGVLYFKDAKDSVATTLTFKDSPIFGKIAINKSGSVVTDFTGQSEGFNYAEQTLAKAVYGLYAGEDIKDESGTLIWAKDTLITKATTTGKDPVYFKNPERENSEDFYLGAYYVKELEAPEGFALDDTKHDVVLTWKKGAKESDVDAWEPEAEDEFNESASTGSYFLAQGTKLNPYIIDAKKVIFTYEKAPDGVDVWDVSEDGISDDANNPKKATSDSTVVLWHDKDDSDVIYVSSQKVEQEIKFNKLSSQMFYKCANLKSIVFFNVDTSNIVDANKMFAYCTSLTKLDLSNWDTHSLNSTVQMFANSPYIEKIYVGTTNMEYDVKAGVPDSLYVTPKLSSYEYYNPTADQTAIKDKESELAAIEAKLGATDLSDAERADLEAEKTTLEAEKSDLQKDFNANKESNRLNFDKFNYSIMFDNGDAEDATLITGGADSVISKPLTADDIESFSPEYPNFGEQSDHSGKLTVTITVKKSSEYYKYTEKDSSGNPTGLLHVTIDVVESEIKNDVDEHPSVTVNAKDESWGMYLSVLKADSAEATTQAADSESADPDVMGDTETGLGSAEFTIYAATDLKSYNTNEDGTDKVIMHEGDVIKVVKSIAKGEDDGGRSGTDLLPFDYYAKDKNAKYLYKVVETKAPTGCALDSTPAYVPNINYRELSADDILAKLQQYNNGTTKVKYSKEDSAFSIAFTFFDTKAPTITKDWGVKGTEGFVEESNRPDHITIRMYKDKAKTQLYKEITLTKDGQWSYTFNEDVDLSKFYYEEDTSNFPDGVQIDTSDYEDGYYVDKENNAVKFYNHWDKNPTQVVLSIHKVWKDNDNASGKRPREIKVTLYQNGVAIDEQKLNESNNWTYEMPEDKALPQYDDVGEEYTYRWEENSDSLGEDYELVSQETNTTESTQYIYMTTELVNAYSKYTTASVRKSWDDEKNLYGQRPENIKVHLLADGKQVNKFTLEVTNADGTVSNKDVTNGEVTLNEKNAWSAKAINLDKYKGKDKIQYTWEEVDVGDGYELAANTTTLENEDEANETFITNLTNKYTPNYGSVKVSKVIPVSSLDLRHGDITFKFDLTGETIHGTQAKDSKSVTFSQDTLSDKGSVVIIDGKQYLKLSVTFDNLDWGDYRVTESGSESRYQFDSIDGLENAKVGKDAKGNSYISFTVNKDLHEFTGTFHNRTIPASVKIVKYGKSGIKKLKGVTFKIEKITGDNKELIKSATTGDEGEVLFDDLAPGDYEITETKTLKGYTLLKDPIKVTLPLTMTKERAEELKADTSKAVYDSEKKLYYFYSVSYKVDNDAGFEVPHTGFKDNLKTYLPLIAAMIMIVGTEIWVCIGRKKPKKRA